MVDAAIIMIENAHKELEREHLKQGRELTNRERVDAILRAAEKMGDLFSFHCWSSPSRLFRCSP